MGIDLGTKTIGIALSDPMKIFASGLLTIKRKKLKDDLEEIKKLIDLYDVDKIVLGLPKNMDNSIGPSAQRSLSFSDSLKKELGIEVILQDERLSTVSAERVLIEQNIRRENRKKYVDKIAATYILQTYLDGR